MGHPCLVTVCGDQRSACGSQFSPSTMRSPEIRLLIGLKHLFQLSPLGLHISFSITPGTGLPGLNISTPLGVLTPDREGEPSLLGLLSG